MPNKIPAEAMHTQSGNLITHTPSCRRRSASTTLHRAKVKSWMPTFVGMTGQGTCLWINHFADWYYLILLQPARIVLFEQAPKPTIPEVFDHPSRYVA